MRISDWSSDVCSSDLGGWRGWRARGTRRPTWRRPDAPRPGDTRPRGSPADPAAPDANAAVAAHVAHAPRRGSRRQASCRSAPRCARAGRRGRPVRPPVSAPGRSEEHTSELQSLMRISYAVFCLKKKKKKIHTTDTEKHKYD